MKRPVLAVALLLGPLVLSACDECAGTLTCHEEPQISYAGQFIEHKSGAPVAGVAITFVRSSGVDATALRAVSDGDGFFTMRAGATQAGTTRGELQVSPPAPYQPYSIPNVSLVTTRVRGDGGNFGRLVVNPYVLLVGHVRDRKTLTPLPGTTVIMRRTSGGRLAQDSMTFVTDFGGQFSWIDPQVIQAGTIHATFEIRADGYPRPYFVPRSFEAQYRDGQQSFVILPVGSGLAYSGTTGRRGSGEQFAGVTVTFTRIGGISTTPTQVDIPIAANGTFGMPIEPLADGTVFGELKIAPPPAFPTELHTLTLRTNDDDSVEWLGFFGYGAQAFFSARLRDAGTGLPLPVGTVVAVKRVGGLSLSMSNLLADGEPRQLDADGALVYQAPTPDSGTVQFDLIVRLPAPFLWDTIRAVTVPARYSDVASDAGVLAVRRRTP